MIRISDLNWGILEIFYLIIIFISGFLTTYLLLPYIIKLMKNKGYIGYDIHKNDRPEVAESGGISMVLGVVVSSILLMVLFPLFLNWILIFILTVILAGVIGFIDDRVKLKSRYKIGLTIFTGSIIFFANYFGYININSPVIPFLGQTRLTILYPLLIPIIVAVFANTTNMLEGYNGEGSGTCLIAAGFILICSIIWDSAEALLFSIITIAVIIPFFMFNRYPAKIFPGDIGTLSMGAMFACIALFGSIEVAVFCALLIHIFNSFYVISSLKGFVESTKISETKFDIILLENDWIKASDQKDAALTLPRLILAKGPLKEPDLVNNFYVISIICGFFSIIAVLLMRWSIGKLNFVVIMIIIIVLLIPTIILIYKFPRIRGVIFLMILLLLASILFLIIIDLIVMPLKYPDFNLIVVRVPVNIAFSFLLYFPMLLLWYYITLKFFWSEINKMRNMQSKS
jgi:UDP-N-acetylmuramyl pentapeptide phosphotransferase/UDP-N-acetylglucosamine-1-phosphate transferase